ncbi:MAG TPA: inositol monophosphatase family protein [Thermoanaerobaculia bacterium]|nr:inositol monophosphatase family protein [Thermoanaerobaculia bacterium]
MEEELLETAIAAARAGADVLTQYFRRDGLQVSRKGQNDFVTEADKKSEAAVLAEIRRRFPDHRILAEEGSAADLNPGSETEWLVDPLDGTTNFLQGLPVWCVSVACRRAGRILAGVVLDPEGDNLFAALRGHGATWNGRPMTVSRHPGLDGAFLATGYPFRALSTLDVYLDVFRDVFRRSKAIRRCGAAALDLAYTAAGVYDGFFEFRLSPWDIGAGIVLIEEAGGVVTDLDGGAGYFRGGNVVAGNRDVQRELWEVVASHAREVDVDRLNPLGPPAGSAAGPA